MGIFSVVWYTAEFVGVDVQNCYGFVCRWLSILQRLCCPESSQRGDRKLGRSFQESTSRISFNQSTFLRRIPILNIRRV